MVRQLKEILLSFNYHSDEDQWEHPKLAGQPLLDPISAGAFGLGAFYAFFRVRKRGWALLLCCFLALVLPAVFSTGQTSWATAYRAVGAVVPLSGLAAAPFAVIWSWAAGRLWMRRSVLVLFALIFVAIGAINYHDYFATYPNLPGWDTGSIDDGFTAVAVGTWAAQQFLNAPPPGTANCKQRSRRMATSLSAYLRPPSV